MHGGRLGMRLAPLLALVLLAEIGSARAHVGPSETTNNRYYKLTPMSDRVRLAYTIFFGREPGLVMRRRMDLDHDGVLSPDEVSAYSQIIANELFASVSFLKEGEEVKPLWQDVDVGFASMDVRAEPFSVDFIATVCLDDRSLGREHQLVFRDRLRLPKPGETELSMAPAPGIRITKSVLAGKPSRHGEKWQGGPGPAQLGYEFAFIVESDEMAVLDKSCAPKSDSRSRRWLFAMGATGLIALVLGALWLRRRRNH